MVKIPFRERLTQGEPLLGDGAMGTLLHQRGAKLESCFDELNLSDADLIVTVHRDYIAAGADLIETNTFSANRYKLAEHNLQDKVTEINHAAVENARRAIEESERRDVYIAGSVGPLGVRLKPYGRVKPEEAREAFK